MTVVYIVEYLGRYTDGLYQTANKQTNEQNGYWL